MAHPDEDAGVRRRLREHQTLSRILTSERLGSYLRWSGGDLAEAFALYEWNLTASAAVMHTTGMVEVIVRNAMDHSLQVMEQGRGWSSWFDDAPLDQRGRADILKARDRATRFGRQAEVHGKVVAELTLGFWRYLAASRYLTVLWTPALHSAFPHGTADKLRQQRQVDHLLRDLLLVRNRAAHHEPIHRRDLLRDLNAAVTLTSWVDPVAGDWVGRLSMIGDVVAAKPTPPTLTT